MTFDREQLLEIEEIIERKFSQWLQQYNILPDLIKKRHVGEGIRFFRAGLAADRPTSGEQNGAAYFATDTDTLSIWNGTAWVDEVFT